MVDMASLSKTKSAVKIGIYDFFPQDCTLNDYSNVEFF